MTSTLSWKFFQEDYILDNPHYFRRVITTIKNWFLFSVIKLFFIRENVSQDLCIVCTSFTYFSPLRATEKTKIKNLLVAVLDTKIAHSRRTAVRLYQMKVAPKFTARSRKITRYKIFFFERKLIFRNKPDIFSKFYHLWECGSLPTNLKICLSLWLAERAKT